MKGHLLDIGKLLGLFVALGFLLFMVMESIRLRGVRDSQRAYLAGIEWCACRQGGYSREECDTRFPGPPLPLKEDPP